MVLGSCTLRQRHKVLLPALGTAAPTLGWIGRLLGESPDGGVKEVLKHRLQARACQYVGMSPRSTSEALRVIRCIHRVEVLITHGTIRSGTGRGMGGVYNEGIAAGQGRHYLVLAARLSAASMLLYHYCSNGGCLLSSWCTMCMSLKLLPVMVYCEGGLHGWSIRRMLGRRHHASILDRCVGSPCHFGSYNPCHSQERRVTQVVTASRLMQYRTGRCH
jgi:hypothetical protein